MPNTLGHPLTVLDEVPRWVHNEMTEMGYDLVPCSWANALMWWVLET